MAVEREQARAVSIHMLVDARVYEAAIQPLAYGGFDVIAR